MAESCMSGCPSYLSADSFALRDRFGKSIGAPMCGRFGFILGSSHSSEAELEQIAMHFGATCADHGMELPTEPLAVNTTVAVPVEVRTTGGDPKAKACFNCKHHVTMEATYKKFGWAVPMCEAKGSLILKPVTEAKGCVYADYGPGHENADHIVTEPIYQSGFRIPDEEIIRGIVDLDRTKVEPTAYPTDKEVTPEDSALGIRAWREVPDPAGTHPSVYLPIFDPSFFDEEERSLIPYTGGPGNPELYVDYNGLLRYFAVEGTKLDETVALIGEPGTGKTQFARWLAWLCQMPFRRLQFQRDMDVEDLLGQTEVNETGTYFNPGELPRAYTKPNVVLSDEPNVGPDAVWQVYRPITDNAKELRIGTHRFPRNQFCYHLLAMNPSHDMRNLGTNELADADANRLSWLLVARAPEPIERHIIRTYCLELDGYEIPEETLDVLMAVSQDIQAASKARSYPGTWATRQQIKVARKTRWYSIPEAYKIATLNQHDEDTMKLILTSVQQHTGLDIPELRDEDYDPQVAQPF